MRKELRLRRGLLALILLGVTGFAPWGAVSIVQAASAMASNDAVTVEAEGGGVLAVQTDAMYFNVYVSDDSAPVTVTLTARNRGNLIEPDPATTTSLPVAYRVEFPANPDEEAASGMVRRRVDGHIVDLIPLAIEENVPQLAPGRICINAQPNYNMAKYRARVEPAGTTADVTVESGGVTVHPAGGSTISPLTVSDGDIIEVRGYEAGPYSVLITHNTDRFSTAEGREIAFKFEFKDVGMAAGPHAAANQYHDIDISAIGNFHYTISMKALLWLESAAPQPQNLPHNELDTHAIHRYKLTTVPNVVVPGRVACRTTLETKQYGLLCAFGVIATKGVGGSQGKAEWQSKHELSGVKNGGPQAGTLHSVSAPQSVFYPWAHTYVNDHRDRAIYPEAEYTVGGVVTAKSWYLGAAERNGAFPNTARVQHGEGVSAEGPSLYANYQIGLTKTFGVFSIVKIME